ncbi:MAG: anti-sigma factor antagonist [Planctomycetota bacterium]
MATLKIAHDDREVDGVGAVRVVTASGSIDSATVKQFVDTLAELVEDAGRTVLDLSGLTYINSSGMAALIKHSDAIGAGGGALVLAGVPDPIISIFDTMGLLATFTVEGDTDAAIARLGDGGAPQPQAAAAAADGVFPLRFACDSCVAELTADKPGRYRCPRCQSCFEATAEGEISTFPMRSAQSVELSVPCAPAFVDIARKAASSVADALEIPSFSSDAQAIDRAVDEAIGLYAGKSTDEARRVRMFVAADSREIRIAFLATDPALAITSDDQSGLTFQTLKGIVDECEIEPLEPSGQVLTLVKKLEG